MLRGKDIHGTIRPELGARAPCGIRVPSLEQRDLLDDVRRVLRVREHSRGNDAGEVVGEVVTVQYGRSLRDEGRGRAGSSLAPGSGGVR